MTFSLLVDTLMQHIDSILNSLKDLTPKYSLGLKVRTVESNELYTWIITGTICGFEYCIHPNHNPGWTYIVAIESSKIFFKNGTTKVGSANNLEFVPEQDVQLLVDL